MHRAAMSQARPEGERLEGYAVLGAGIVGACVALALQRDGHKVTLIDCQEPGHGCSFGNAGLLHSGGCVPLASPGSLRQLPAMLADPQGALRISWAHLPVLLPWLLRFLGQARADRVQHNVRALQALLRHARPAYAELLRDAGLRELVRPGGELYVYRGEASFRAAQWEMQLRREQGVPVHDLGADEVHALEPALAPAYRHGHYLPDSDYVLSPAGLVQGLVTHFSRQGGKVLRREVRQARPHESGGAMLHTDQGPLHASGLVLCCGAWSGRLAEQLGTRVPLESWRGHHIMVGGEAPPLGRVVVDGDKHIAVTPMAQGMRVAGYLEMAGLERPAHPRRGGMLLALARDMLPGFPDTVTSTWMGHRPGTPDSLPVIGPEPRCKNVYYAFGHGQLGLTFGAVTGRLLADLVAGRQGVIDPRPYRAGRFGREREAQP